MGLLFETIFLTKNNVKSGDKTHQRGRKTQKTVACGKRENGKFSICSKSPQKAATNWLYTKGAVGEETKPPHKVDLLPFEKGSPKTLDAGTARTSRRRLRHPTVPPPMPGNRRAADRLLTLSTPVEFPIQTAPALLLFHGAVFFVSRPCAHIVRLGLFLLLLPKLPAAC